MSLTKVTYSMIQGEVFNVLDFGADNTGTTDSYAAIQAALDAAKNSSTIKTVYFPSGEYESSAELVVGTNVALIGEDTRVYHLFYDANTPRMPVIRFTNDTDGLVFNAQFFKNQIKNLGIWSGLAAATSTKIGLRLSTNDATVAASTTYEGLGNIYENFEVFGFKLGIKISGAYSWYQHFKDFQVHNCESAIDIECRSVQQTRFDNFYINCDGAVWTHANRTGITHRAGGRIVIDNGIIENMNNSILFMPPTYTDMADTAIQKQMQVTNLYSEACLANVFFFGAAAILDVKNLYASYAFYNSFANVFRIAPATLLTEKVVISARNVEVVGDAAPANRRFRKLFGSTTNCPPALYDVNIYEFDPRYNEFEVFWEVNYPPTTLTFSVRDDAGNQVAVYQRSTQTARAYAVIENDDGSIPATSLQWTNTFGNVVNLATMTLQLTTTRPIRTAGRGVIYDTAAPTTGTWADGDIVWNSAPVAGGTPGWMCVTAGTPGTWKAMANLAP